MAIRAKGSSIAVCCNVLINILFNQISPIAFANVGWKYYSLFICTNAVGAITVFFLFPETKGKSLEEIGAIFGDEVITADLDTIQQKNLANEEHIEDQAMENDGSIVPAQEMELGSVHVDKKTA